MTGGAGFIGSHVVDALLARGDRVRVLDDLSTGSRSNLASALEAGAELVVADVRDAPTIASCHEEFEPDVVVHLAAQVDVRKAVADPALDAEINVVGTVNVLEAALRADRAPVVFASTGGAIYGEGSDRALPFSEEADLRPESAYGTSKLSGERYLELYGRLHRLRGLALRFGNVYGPRQDPHGEAGVVAIFCGRLRAGLPPLIFGDGEQTRDYIHVDDVVAAAVAAAERLVGGASFGGPLNVGTGTETTVAELAEQLSRIAGSTAEPDRAPARRGEILRVAIDPAAAARQLDWVPRVELAAGLAETFRATDGG